MPIGKSLQNVTHGNFWVMPFSGCGGNRFSRSVLVIRLSSLVRMASHLTSRSSRSLRSLGHSALRTCSGLASPLSPEQALHAECRLPWR